MSGNFADVYVELKNRRLDRTFHYRIPKRLKGKVLVGTRVVIPFGRKRYQGYVVDMTDHPRAKEIKV